MFSFNLFVCLEQRPPVTILIYILFFDIFLTGDFVHNGDFETGHLGAWQCTGSDCNVVQGQDGGLVAIKLELFAFLLQAPPGGERSEQ